MRVPGAVCVCPVRVPGPRVRCDAQPPEQPQPRGAAGGNFPSPCLPPWGSGDVRGVFVHPPPVGSRAWARSAPLFVSPPLPSPPNSHNSLGENRGKPPGTPFLPEGGQLSLTSPLSLLLSSSLTRYTFHQSLPQTFNYSINGRPYIFQGSVSLGKRQYRVHGGRAAGRTLKP